MEDHDHGTLHDYLAVVRRRKWIALAAIVLVPAAAVAFSLRQEDLYRAHAQVLISRQNLTASLAGIAPDPSLYQQPQRLVETQADLARVPLIARRTLREVGLSDRSPTDFLEASSVSATRDTDLLTFKVTDHEPMLARRLATEYARQFTIYRRRLDTAAIGNARREVEERIARLEASGNTSSPVYEGLVEKQQLLLTMKALQTSNAFVVRRAGPAAHVQPRPVRNGLFGLALGLVLGLGLAFLREALDTRVRTAEDVAHLLGLPLLARLPEPPRKLRAGDRLVMLEEPLARHAEAFRILRTNLEFANLERDARAIMVTSAVQGEGKSTTAANLAVAWARAGKHVVLVDLDLRGPCLDRFFRLDGHPGLTQALLNLTRLDEVLVPVALDGVPGDGARPSDLNGQGTGMLEVVASGPVPPNPGELVVSRALGQALEELADRADILIVDAPPLLSFGDAPSLTEKVDAILVVTRLKAIRRPVLNELRRVLDACPVAKLGFVVADSQTEEPYGYGYGYGYGYRYSYGPLHGAAQNGGVQNGPVPDKRRSGKAAR